MPNPILSWLCPFSLATGLDQLRQQGGEILLHCNVHCVLCRIFKVSNDIVFNMAVMTVVDVGPAKAVWNFHALYIETFFKDLPEVLIDWTRRGSIKAVISCSTLNNIFSKSRKRYVFIFVDQICMGKIFSGSKPMLYFKSYQSKLSWYQELAEPCPHSMIWALYDI